MKYMGSKRRLANDLIPIVLKNRYYTQYYVEPFCGGCNLVDKIKSPRIANDINYYIIEMFKALQEGWLPPKEISEDEYADIKKNQHKYNPALIGFVGVNCAFAASWFRGYARCAEGRNYALQGYNSLLKQKELLKGIEFKCGHYDELDIPKHSIIYCDPPYKGTTQYCFDKFFNHDKFYDWCVEKNAEGHTVFISEYDMPSDRFEEIWNKEIICNVNNNKQASVRLEKLYKVKRSN